jgi:hypothetical protein
VQHTSFDCTEAKTRSTDTKKKNDKNKKTTQEEEQQRKEAQKKRAPVFGAPPTKRGFFLSCLW